MKLPFLKNTPTKKANDFGHNERRFYFEFIIKMKSRPMTLIHDPESTFYSGSIVRLGMKNGMNSIRNESRFNPDSCKQV